MAGSVPVPTLDQPYPGASFGTAVKRFFAKYATFTGRASRSEFWWWFLANAIVASVLSSFADIGGGATGASGPTGLYISLNSVLGVWELATLVPNLALAWRRLHDTNRAGPWWLLTLIPVVGWIIVIVLEAFPSDPQGARFDAAA